MTQQSIVLPTLAAMFALLAALAFLSREETTENQPGSVQTLRQGQ